MCEFQKRKKEKKDMVDSVNNKPAISQGKNLLPPKEFSIMTPLAKDSVWDHITPAPASADSSASVFAKSSPPPASVVPEFELPTPVAQSPVVEEAPPALPPAPAVAPPVAEEAPPAKPAVASNVYYVTGKPLTETLDTSKAAKSSIIPANTTAKAPPEVPVEPPVVEAPASPVPVVASPVAEEAAPAAPALASNVYYVTGEPLLETLDKSQVAVSSIVPSDITDKSTVEVPVETPVVAEAPVVLAAPPSPPAPPAEVSVPAPVVAAEAPQVESKSLKVPHGATLSKVSQKAYGTYSPEVLDAIYKANPDAVSEVFKKNPNGSEMNVRDLHLLEGKELILPKTLMVDGKEIHLNEDAKYPPNELLPKKHH